MHNYFVVYSERGTRTIYTRVARAPLGYWSLESNKLEWLCKRSGRLVWAHMPCVRSCKKFPGNGKKARSYMRRLAAREVVRSVLEAQLKKVK